MKSLILLLLCGVVPLAAAPQFSLPGGVYTNDITLQLSASSTSAVIRVTLDGSEPTATSGLYSAALMLTNSTLVRARAFEGETPSGPGLSQTYILLDTDLFDFSSNLPMIIVNTFGQSLSHDAKAP